MESINQDSHWLWRKSVDWTKRKIYQIFYENKKMINKLQNLFDICIIVAGKTSTDIQQIEMKADIFSEIKKFSWCLNRFGINRRIQTTTSNMKTDSNHLKYKGIRA